MRKADLDVVIEATEKASAILGRMGRTGLGTQLAFNLDALVADCIEIAREEHGGIIRSKWAMGNRILNEFALIDPETGNRGRIQYGALKAVAEGIEAEFGDSHGYGYATLQKCLTFARRVHEDELRNIIPQFKTWFGVLTQFLGHRNFEDIHSSESNEWYTPSEYLDAAHDVMGGIDLDPASNEMANKVVQATAFYDTETDGLHQDWSGRVWLNPPWGQETGHFVTKLVQHVQDGSVSEAICLVNAHATDTEWFQGLWDGLLCFTDHRINFYHPEDKGNGSNSTHGSVFVYFGANKERFISEFQRFGTIVQAIEHPGQG